jgi:hypothetical protein
VIGNIFRYEIYFLSLRENPLKKYLLTLATVAFLPQVVSAQQAEVNPIPQLSDEWKYTVTPYLWLPNYSPTLSAGGQEISPDGGTSQSKALGYVSGGFMLAGEAHKNRYGVLADFFNGSMKNVDYSGTLTSNLGWNLTQTMFTAAGTYNLLQDKQAYVDVLAGLRVMSVTGTANFKKVIRPTESNLNAAYTFTTVDPVVGLKGRVRIADSSWFVPFYGDIGGGGKSSLTWQANVGVGKAFTWGDLALGYRVMGYEAQKDILPNQSGDTKLKMNMGAFILTGNFTF